MQPKNRTASKCELRTVRRWVTVTGYNQRAQTFNRLGHVSQTKVHSDTLQNYTRRAELSPFIDIDVRKA